MLNRALGSTHIVLPALTVISCGRQSLILLTIGVVLSTSDAFAQAPDTLWVRTYGDTGQDYGYSVEATSDGGYILAGSTDSNPGTISDVLLIKTDAAGDTLWTRTFGGGLPDGANAVDQTYDGGYVAAGYFGNRNTDPNLYLIRLDSNGDSLWTRTFGGLLRRDIGHDVVQTSDSGYVVTGEIQVTGPFTELWLLKTDASGIEQWSRALGGGGIEKGYSVRQTSDGGYVAVGETASRGVTGAGDVWIVKTDANGDTLWTRNYGGPGYDVGKEVRQTPDGGYVVVGSYASPINGESDVWLLRTNAAGDTLWTKRFDGGGEDAGESLDLTMDGGFVISAFRGLVEDELWVIKTDANGNALWTTSFGEGGSDRSGTVRQAPDGAYVIGGYTSSRGAGGIDFLLVKLESNQQQTATEPDRPGSEFGLHHYPNPAGSHVVISYRSGRASPVDLALYDVLGRKVWQLVEGSWVAGRREVRVDVAGLPAGIYFYRLHAGGYIGIRSLVVVR